MSPVAENKRERMCVGGRIKGLGNVLFLIILIVSLLQRKNVTLNYKRERIIMDLKEEGGKIET